MANGFNQFSCPLCGRNVSLKKYDPTKYDNDIYGKRIEGLGYAKGFGPTQKGSILNSGDPILDLIANRVLEISRFMMEAGIITENQLAHNFPVSESNKETQAKLESEVEALEVDVEELKNKNTGLKNEAVKLDSEVMALEVEVEDLERKNAGLKKEVEELREQLETMDEGDDEDEDDYEDEGETDENDDDVAEIISMLDEVIGEEFDESYGESDYSLDTLKNMTAFLINEYEALVE